MKKLLYLFATLMMATGLQAQTLNIVIGKVTYQIPASQAGDMVSSGTTAVTILDRSYDWTEIDSMYIDNAEVADNTVSVAYDGAAARVLVAGNCARYLTVTASGADVSIVQSADLARELTYTLSGTSTDGSFYMDGEFKATLVLSNLTLTNADGAAINIENGKRIAIDVEGTNILSDGASSTDKAAFMVNGHSEFTGSGTLRLYGLAKHAFWGDEYVQLKKSMTGAIQVMSAVKDGLNINQYYEQNGGTVTITDVGDDGLQVSADDEEGGYVNVQGGTLDITVTAAASKGVNAEGNVTIGDSKSTPSITIKATGGGKWDTDDAETKASACIKSDANVLISAGNLTLTSTGAGGKGISCDSTLTITGGSVSATTTGSVYTYGSSGTPTYGPGGGFGPGGGTTNSAYKSSPKGLKCKYGDMILSGGTITVKSSGSEAIEGKQCIYITDSASVNAYSADDAINSGSHLYIRGGTVVAYAVSNDGLDANGNIYVQGGTTVAYGARSPECGIDANEEEGYSVFFTGGKLFAIGGGNSYPSSSASTQCYVTSSGSVTQNSTVTLKSGSTTLATFSMPYSYSSGSVLVTAPGMSNGSTYTLTLGSSSKSVTAVQYKSGR